MSLLLTDRGLPAPPQDIVRALRQIDNDLGLMWVAGSNCWAFTIRWRATDTRQQKRQTGEIAPDADFDIMGYLPADCPADQAYGYFVKSVKRMTGTPDEINAMLSKVHHWNDAVAREQNAAVEEYAGELFRVNRHKIAEGLGQQSIRPVYQSESRASTRGRKRSREALG